MDVPAIVVEPGDGRSVSLGGMGVVFKVCGADTGGAFRRRTPNRTGAASAAPCPPARGRVFLGSTWSLDFSPVGTRPQSRSHQLANTRNNRTGNSTDHNSCRRKHKSLYRSDGHPNDRGRYCRDLSRPCGRRNRRDPLRGRRGPLRGQSRDLRRHGLHRRGLHRRLVRTRLCRSPLSLCRARWP
jgi:hypothetical protein